MDEITQILDAEDGYVVHDAEPVGYFVDVENARLTIFAFIQAAEGWDAPIHLTIVFEGMVAYRFADIGFGRQNVLSGIEVSEPGEADPIDWFEEGECTGQEPFSERLTKCRAFVLRTNVNMYGTVYARSAHAVRRKDATWAVSSSGRAP